MNMGDLDGIKCYDEMNDDIGTTIKQKQTEGEEQRGHKTGRNNYD